MAPFSNLTWFAESAEAVGCSLFILPSHESRNCSLIDCAQYRVQLVSEQERISSEKKKMRSTGSTAFGIPWALENGGNFEKPNLVTCTHEKSVVFPAVIFFQWKQKPKKEFHRCIGNE
jgi:hypothetical protein